MDKITPFLWFDRQAEEAAKFYISIFKNGKIIEATPMSVTFELFGRRYLALNGGPHYKLTPAFSFFVSCKTQKEVDTFWAKLTKGGKELRCGWLEDKFGLAWQIIPEVLGQLLYNKDREKAGRTMEAMMGMRKLDIAALKAAAAGSPAKGVKKATTSTKKATKPKSVKKKR